jgi:hypothetical protein
MNRNWTISGLFAVLLLSAALPAVAQQDIQPARIPQRVFFEPTPSGLAETNPTLSQLPEYLYTALAAIQPIVRVTDRTAANSTVAISRSGRSIAASLESGGETQATEELSGVPNNRAIVDFVDQTAKKFAPFLQFVEPKVVKVAGPEAEKTRSAQELISTVQLKDRYAKPFEMTLWGAGVLTFASESGNNSRSEAAWNGLPASFDFSWFLNRHFGVVASVWTYFGESLTFGDVSNGGPGYVRGFFALPGVGITYRTVGRLFAELGAIAYAGYGHITNITSQTIGRDLDGNFSPFMAPGESKSIFYPLVSLSSSLGYSISPSFALRTSIELSFTPASFYSDSTTSYNSFVYPVHGSGIFFRLFSLGLSYRF